MKNLYKMFLILLCVFTTSYGSIWDQIVSKIKMPTKPERNGKGLLCKVAKERADEAQEKYKNAVTSTFTKMEKVKELNAKLEQAPPKQIKKVEDELVQAEEEMRVSKAYMKAAFKENAKAHENLRNCERMVRGGRVAPLPRPVGGPTTLPVR